MMRVVPLVLLAGLICVGASEAGRAGVPFPGVEKSADSPDGRFSVVWVPADEAAGGQHRLLLRDKSSGRERPLQVFDRWVTVLWASSSTRVAVTDGVGTDSSEVRVYRTDDLALPIDVRQVLEADGRKRLGFTAGADHCYIEAVDWVSDTELVVRVWGYGGAKPFDRTLRVKILE